VQQTVNDAFHYGLFAVSSGGAAAIVQWAIIVVAVADFDPEAFEDSPDYAGTGYYLGRINNYDNWESNHSPAYVLNDKKIDTTDTSITSGVYRLYKMINAGGISNPTLAPHENTTDWELTEEDIKIEYAKGYDNSGYSLKNFFPKFAVGEVVKITSRVVDEETRYYLDDTLTHIGDYNLRGITCIEGRWTGCWV
jgi:hypothetical protein